MAFPLDSRQLRAFACLAQTGNFTEAGRVLGLSQSAISHSIKALEGDLRCRLLDRLGKKVTLTQAGEQFLVSAQKILREMDYARESLAGLGRWGQGRLRLSASLTACQYLLPPVLREFKESFPHCTIEIEPGDSTAAVDLLRQRRVDLAIVAGAPEDAQFHFQPLFTDELSFITSPLHSWAQAGRVVRGEIVQQKYILYARASLLVGAITGYFRQDGLEIPAALHLGNMEAIKPLVKLGLGITILAPWVARTELAEGSLVALPLGRRKLRRQWGLLSWQQHRRTLAEETFCGLCTSVAAQL